MKIYKVKMRHYGMFVRPEEIEELEVDRVTEKSLFFSDGRREELFSDWKRCFLSLNEAETYYENNALSQIGRMEDEIETFKQILSTFSTRRQAE